MAGGSREIQTEGYIVTEQGAVIALEELSEAELTALRRRWEECAGRALSAYYGQHPEEYAALLTGLKIP